MISQTKIKSFSKSADALARLKEDLELLYGDMINCSRVMKSDVGDQYFILATCFMEDSAND
jgi:hypothetical protein